ncbi:hypothetical protein FHU36_008458 [Nonomuraea muscovyensis]|uniref:Uncharacterized protein n=1 Tax=Nonomuraea muscovyensis TaxID=1124761 RepID=A0A7X0F373_9ACTN|nr:hypothetical protein [Nonomuraea muscovyensis]MBB6351875.1 hypothetical protein [Nonomuraea muscovyensis]
MPQAVKTRINFETGYAETEGGTPLVRVGDRLLPQRITVVVPCRAGQPRITARLEVLDGIPQCRELSFASLENGREIKQLDLRDISIADLVERTFALFSQRVILEESDHMVAVQDFGSGARAEAARIIGQARKGKGARKITPAFLAEVAKVYREHGEKNPTQAVQRAFDVSPRMAGNYIRKARDLELLPEVTDGRRKR